MDQNQIEKTKQAYTAALDELDQLKKEYMKKVREQGESALKGAFTTFFSANPQVAAVAWNQYTPYFNDGEPCEFSVHDPNFLLASAVQSPEAAQEAIDEFRWGDESPWFTAWGLKAASEGNYIDDVPDKDSVIQDAQKTQAQAVDFERIFRAHEDLFQMTFGDHVTVIAKPTGFTVNDCEHD